MPSVPTRRLAGRKLVSIGGIPIRIDSSWILIFLVVAWSAAAYFPRTIEGGMEPEHALLLGLVASLVLFASILAHELSHSLVARALGYRVRSITLFIFGGVSEIEEEPRSARDEGMIALVGPLMSVAIALAFQGAALVTRPGGAGHALVRYLAATNFAIAIFNLFPGFPLDGGRVLRAIFRGLGDDLVESTRKASIFGRAIGFALIGLGIASFAFGGVLSGVWLALIGWFLKGSADASYAQVAFKATIEDLAVGEAAERLVPLSPEATVRSALLDHGLLAGGFERYPVAREGLLVGTVHVGALRAIPRARWDEVRVGELLDGQPEVVVSSEASLFEALERMVKAGRSEVPVVDGTGAYRGVLRLDDVTRLATYRKMTSPGAAPG